jgi:hypothetical protein
MSAIAPLRSTDPLRADPLIRASERLDAALRQHRAIKARIEQAWAGDERSAGALRADLEATRRNVADLLREQLAEMADAGVMQR